MRWFRKLFGGARSDEEEEVGQPAGGVEMPLQKVPPPPLGQGVKPRVVPPESAQGIDHELLAAVAEGRTTTVETLLRKGANPSAYGKCARYEDFGEHSPLGLAARRGNAEMVQLLLQYGADVTGYTNGVTPLHEAVEHKDVVEVLVSHGADVNAEGGFSLIRPIHWAVVKSQREVVELLLKHGADPNAKNGSGDSPLYIARRDRLPEIEALLLNHGATVLPPVKSRCSDCRAEIVAVPDTPFRCPKCGAEWPKWHPPAYWISAMGEEGGMRGRDQTACSYAKDFLNESEDLQILVLQLSGPLSQWEAAYRGASTRVMAECEDKIRRVRERIEELGGCTMWYRACMAMPPHLRHVASSDFDTAGNYHGTEPLAAAGTFAYTRVEGEDSAERKAALLGAFDRLGVGPAGFDMLMWRLANAAMDGESRDTVLDYLYGKILKGAVQRQMLVELLDDATKELNSSAEYMKPELTNLNRYEK
ncbi:MAG: hypothetical protein FJ290_30645 [Planctomycetes bacterium]|nr:hypothetical protein [Planctomycetota bacterium]